MLIEDISAVEGHLLILYFFFKQTNALQTAESFNCLFFFKLACKLILKCLFKGFGTNVSEIALYNQLLQM